MRFNNILESRMLYLKYPQSEPANYNPCADGYRYYATGNKFLDQIEAIRHSNYNVDFVFMVNNIDVSQLSNGCQVKIDISGFNVKTAVELVKFVITADIQKDLSPYYCVQEALSAGIIENQVNKIMYQVIRRFAEYTRTGYPITIKICDSVFITKPSDPNKVWNMETQTCETDDNNQTDNNETAPDKCSSHWDGSSLTPYAEFCETKIIITTNETFTCYKNCQDVPRDDNATSPERCAELGGFINYDGICTDDDSNPFDPDYGNSDESSSDDIPDTNNTATSTSTTKTTQSNPDGTSGGTSTSTTTQSIEMPDYNPALESIGDKIAEGKKATEKQTASDKENTKYLGEKLDDIKKSIDEIKEGDGTSGYFEGLSSAVGMLNDSYTQTRANFDLVKSQFENGFSTTSISSGSNPSFEFPLYGNTVKLDMCPTLSSARGIIAWVVQLLLLFSTIKLMLWGIKK
jgi:hypothetical protein